MSYEFYKVIHLLGIVTLFLTIGGAAFLGLAIGKTTSAEDEKSLRKLLSILHGVAMLIILVAGFGLMARLGMMGGWPTWIYGKIALWLAFGASVGVLKKKPESGRMWIVLAPVLGATAAYLAVAHPGG